MATGVLPVFVGGATKAADMAAAQSKEYIAAFALGWASDTQDSTGTETARSDVRVTEQQLREAVDNMHGEQEQIPPKFSAKFINGVRAYEMARAGEEVEMRPARIRIDAIDILEFDNPCLKVNIKCSKGTYIRSLARDIGAVLESGGHLTGLRRTRSGSFLIEKAVPLEKFIEILKNN